MNLHITASKGSYLSTTKECNKNRLVIQYASTDTPVSRPQYFPISSILQIKMDKERILKTQAKIDKKKPPLGREKKLSFDYCDIHVSQIQGIYPIQILNEWKYR